jgi:phenylacetate-coenzyme A ligase PaaK-like adenylate-forming protein
MTPALANLSDRTAIEAHQTRKLQALMQQLLASNEFYAAKLRAAGVWNVPQSIGEFSATSRLLSRRN